MEGRGGDLKDEGEGRKLGGRRPTGEKGREEIRVLRCMQRGEEEEEGGGEGSDTHLTVNVIFQRT